MKDTNETRRRFMAHFAGIGMSSTLLPGILWAGMQQSGTQRVTPVMMADSLKLAGLEFSDEERTAMVNNVNQALTRYEALHNFKIPNDISPPFHFNPIVPGMKVNRTRQPFRISDAPVVKRPSNLEDVAFWSVRQLAELIRTKQVSSVELTTMYLERLKKYNPVLNCVVSFTDDLAMQQAKQADAEIKGGRYKGPLHGIPWGAKDIIAAKGYKTTWGSGAYKDQVLDYDASVIEFLRDAGAVLIAKLTTGELAGGANWFGGRTNNPWDPSQASGGSSAGPGSATGGGCVGFSVGTETSGSILGPSSTCGVTGLRPTLGRISRYGVMALSWTQDRLGPMCRYAEDCAIVMQAIARPDDRDMSVQDIPFNWNANLDITKLRVGYVKKAFDGTTNPVNKANDQATLDALTKLGLKVNPIDIPDFPVSVASHDVEMAVFFDELVRSGRVKLMTGQTRGVSFRASRLVPAVEYLQSQRARMMMMMQLAKATEGVDVFLLPRAAGGGGGRGAAAGATEEAEGARGARGGRGGGGGGDNGPVTVSAQCNFATYPAVAVPNGFTAAGTPTSMTFFARPFGETELLAVAKAYQDATGHHLKHPVIKT